jgi:hypothetical protein
MTATRVLELITHQVRVQVRVAAVACKICFYKKEQWRPLSKKRKRKNLSPINRKACHSISTRI